MKVELRALSLADGLEFYEMIKEVGSGENGFTNNAYSIDYMDFPDYLKRSLEEALGINLAPGYVPQSTFWLLVDEKPVGIGKLRHYLTDRLRETGGHIGYTIRPTQRQKGYGVIILRELLGKAEEMGLRKVLLTCNEDNLASIKVITANGGRLQDIIAGKCRYWIDIG